MMKTMDILALKDLPKGDDIWKFWEETRAPRIALQPAIQRYTLSRVLDGSDKARDIWGIEDIWYDLDPQSFAARWAALQAVPQWKKQEDDWHARFDWFATFQVEEIPMLDRTITDPPDIKMVKSVAFHEPIKGLDLVKQWDIWINEHGPRHLYPMDTPAMRKYTISRIDKTLAGDAHGIWGIAELWQNFPDVSAFKQREVPSGRMGQEWVHKWHDLFPWSPTVITKEKVIVKKKSPR